MKIRGELDTLIALTHTEINEDILIETKSVGDDFGRIDAYRYVLV